MNYSLNDSFEGTEPEQNIEKENKITTLQFLRLDFLGITLMKWEKEMDSDITLFIRVPTGKNLTLPA